MREYIYSLMTDRREGLIAALMKVLLSIASLFYGLSVRFIRFINRRTAKSLPCKVVSIGNLTLGGTGKTPTACMVAKFLKSEGKNPCVLIRGYGEDEWKMLESLLGDIPVVVGRDRVSSGSKACSEYNADTVVLDDGFQHWRLKRDLNIVLVDSTNPFGNRRLFPRGLLREEIDGLRRADIIMLTKTDMGSRNLGYIKEELKKRTPDISILESVHSPTEIYNLYGRKALGLSALKERDICVLSSIVNTEYFEYTLKNLGANISARFHYPDHYDYKKSDLEDIIKECKKSGINTIVTTEKDAVKLYAKRYMLNAKHEMQILVLHIETKVTNGADALYKRLRSLYRS
ncbi:MAG: tetraacyldisaccharide 4'-kinase [Candidatus Omnitrophica bacterium]|nr:tetraacyldisaccharide 4'-kinase [Candidatus Omnitrophota bacterium]